MDSLSHYLINLDDQIRSCILLTVNSNKEIPGLNYVVKGVQQWKIVLDV